MNLPLHGEWKISAVRYCPTVNARFPRALFHGCHSLVPQAVLLDRVASCSHPWQASTHSATLPPLLPGDGCLSLPWQAWAGRTPWEGACRGLCAFLPPHQDCFSYTSQHVITTQPSVEEILCCTPVQKQAQTITKLPTIWWVSISRSKE